MTLSGTTGASIGITAANPSATGDDMVITVEYTVNGEGNSDQAHVTTHMPTNVIVVSDTNNTTGKACSVPCLANPGNGTCNANSSTCNYNSYLREREYSVVDQLTPALEFISVGINAANVTESVPYTTSCPNFTLNTHNSTTSTWFDDFFLCHTCCLSGGPGCSVQTNPTQVISVNGVQLRTETINWTCSSVTLTP